MTKLTKSLAKIVNITKIAKITKLTKITKLKIHTCQRHLLYKTVMKNQTLPIRFNLRPLSEMLYLTP